MHALFHILHVYLRLFWCSIEHYRCPFRTRYKRNTIPGPDINKRVTYLDDLNKTKPFPISTEIPYWLEQGFHCLNAVSCLFDNGFTQLCKQLFMQKFHFNHVTRLQVMNITMVILHRHFSFCPIRRCYGKRTFKMTRRYRSQKSKVILIMFLRQVFSFRNWQLTIVFQIIF